MSGSQVCEPPSLPIDTEVSAKYKGAFCEARIKKVNRSVKCKVTFKNGQGTFTLFDNLIRGPLRVNARVKAKHPGRNQLMEAVVNKIIDQSQYTVVFGDGDEKTLRRTLLCLKSGKHFAESETLDQLPLTNPEHLGNLVSLGKSDCDKLDESAIGVGQRLKVKYGRGRQLKGYEAKVLKMEVDPLDGERRYFVHYPSWNSRYDEWIKKPRIIEMIRDKSPKSRSGKVKNKGEPLNELTIETPSHPSPTLPQSDQEPIASNKKLTRTKRRRPSQVTKGGSSVGSTNQQTLAPSSSSRRGQFRKKKKDQKEPTLTLVPQEMPSQAMTMKMVKKEEEPRKLKRTASQDPDPANRSGGKGSRKRKGGRKKKKESSSAKKMKTTPSSSKFELADPMEGDSTLELEKSDQDSSQFDLTFKLKRSHSQDGAFNGDELFDRNNNLQVTGSPSESDFLLCKEEMPASPESQPKNDDMDCPEPVTEHEVDDESPRSSHSLPRTGEEPMTKINNRDPKKSRSSLISEVKNESFVASKELLKMANMVQENHDELKPDFNKSLVGSSTKKQRRERRRTVSQSQAGEPSSVPKESGVKMRSVRNGRYSPLHDDLQPTSMALFVPQSRFNFCLPIVESVDPDRRVLILQDRINNLRETFLSIKAEVAILDRKKKKARKKEREKSVNNTSTSSDNHKPTPTESSSEPNQLSSTPPYSCSINCNVT